MNGALSAADDDVAEMETQLCNRGPHQADIVSLWRGCRKPARPPVPRAWVLRVKKYIK